jgi:hypothetical protein
MYVCSKSVLILYRYPLLLPRAAYMLSYHLEKNANVQTEPFIMVKSSEKGYLKPK